MWRSLTRERKWQCCSTTTTFVKLERFRQGQGLLAHELVQPLLDKCSNGDIGVAGPHRRSVSNDVRLKGKHFSVSKHPMKKAVLLVHTKKKVDGKQKKTKTSNFCKKFCVYLQKIFCPVPYQK